MINAIQSDRDIESLGSPQQTQSMGGTFKSLMEDHLAKTNEYVNKSDDLAARFIKGEDVEIHEMMIATQKASLALELTSEIRNKAIEAYRELSRMQM